MSTIDDQTDKVRKDLKRFFEQNMEWIEVHGLKDLEGEVLRSALLLTNGIQKEAAEMLRVSPRVFNYKMTTRGLREEWNTRGTELYRARAASHFRAAAVQEEAPAPSALSAESAEPV